MEGVSIRVSTDDFDVGREYAALRAQSTESGAIVVFTGLVRDFNAQGALQGIILEHYPAMTQKTLSAIAERAKAQWPLEAITIVHRIGELKGQDQIVLVGVSSRHRAAAFEAAQFIMDYLKTEAPFWKKEVNAQGESQWVDAKESDQRARDRW